MIATGKRAAQPLAAWEARPCTPTTGRASWKQYEAYSRAHDPYLRGRVEGPQGRQHRSWILARGSAPRDPRQNTPNAWPVPHDVTERKEAEAHPGQQEKLDGLGPDGGRTWPTRSKQPAVVRSNNVEGQSSADVAAVASCLDASRRRRRDSAGATETLYASSQGAADRMRRRLHDQNLDDSVAARADGLATQQTSKDLRDSPASTAATCTDGSSSTRASSHRQHHPRRRQQEKAGTLETPSATYPRTAAREGQTAVVIEPHLQRIEPETRAGQVTVTPRGGRRRRGEVIDTARRSTPRSMRR